jgi:hypothetical protein
MLFLLAALELKIWVTVPESFGLRVGLNLQRADDAQPAAHNLSLNAEQTLPQLRTQTQADL